MKLFRAAFLYKIIQKYTKFMSARNLLQNYFPFFQQFSDAILSFTRPSPLSFKSLEQNLRYRGHLPRKLRGYRL